jgi:hypothetical protein
MADRWNRRLNNLNGSPGWTNLSTGILWLIYKKSLLCLLSSIPDVSDLCFKVSNILSSFVPDLTADRPVSDWFLSFSNYVYKNDIKAGNTPFQPFF